MPHYPMPKGRDGPPRLSRVALRLGGAGIISPHSSDALSLSAWGTPRPPAGGLQGGKLRVLCPNPIPMPYAMPYAYGRMLCGEAYAIAYHMYMYVMT